MTKLTLDAAKKTKLTATPEFKIAEGLLNPQTMNDRTIVNYLDDQIKKRELSVEKRIRLV